MHVEVRFGARLSTAAGTSRLRVTLPHDATVDTLLRRLGEIDPGLVASVESALPVVRGTHASRTQPLADGDEVALLIPVAGGEPFSTSSERRDSWP